MAAATPLPSSSLPPSSSLNTSHSSVGSEGFVVVDKSSSLDENLRISQTNGEDRVEMKLQNEKVLEGGSVYHNGLLQRIQCLTKENEELKGVLVKNNKILEGYFKDLPSLQTDQKQNIETLCKGYDQAKDVVKKLREKNESLKAELKSEQEKNQQLEEQLEKQKEEKTGEEGVSGDADLKEKYLKVKKRLWNYQKKENYIQDKENALLEKEETYKIQLQQQSKDLERHLENARMKEDALIEEKQKHEKETQHLKKQLSETHEQEVLLLKEELHLKNEEMTAVQNSEKNLKEQLAKLQQEKQNVLMECEQCEAEWVEKEEEGKSLMPQLSEKHKQENFVLKEKLRSTELALDSSQNKEEHLKLQVTKLIEENLYLACSRDNFIDLLEKNQQIIRLWEFLSKGAP